MHSVVSPELSLVSPPLQRSDVFVTDDIAIPGWVVDLSSYRRWAVSEDYPRTGWVSFLDGVVFVDPSMEELFTHNQVKGAFAVAISNLLGPTPAGMFAFDRMLLTNPEAGLVTEPDGLFFFWATVQAKRLQMIEGAAGIVELLGAPDMTLEVVSKHSVSKDTKKLRELYWKAGVPEYWIVDARGAEPEFQILRHSDAGYLPVEAVDGWTASGVFQRQFQIVKQINPLGQPQFVVHTRS